MNVIVVSNYTLDSREVTEMVGKDHKNLLRDINVLSKNLLNSIELKVELSDFIR